jgi:hypothetical protein
MLQFLRIVPRFEHYPLSFYYAMKLDEINADFNYQDETFQIVKDVTSYWLSGNKRKAMHHFMFFCLLLF